MLRTQLADRFGLRVHTEQKEMQTYLLTVMGSGLEFDQSTTDGPPSHGKDKGGAMVAQRVSMNELAQGLSGRLNRPVIDSTGLKGGYDFRIDTLPYVEAAAAVNGGKADQMSEMDIPGILIAALPDELRLKLESRKEKADILVVDYAEKTPTAD
jgi:uncharacterized protein (TIGR03435 family)